MIIANRIEKRKRSIDRRLNGPLQQDFSRPMFSATAIRYEMADRTRAISYGGIGLVHRLVGEIGLADSIDKRLHLLKIHLPYHESDHVLNISYNAICEGRCLEDIELRRNDETFLDALGTQRIPDPTTAGDFCRRFTSAASIASPIPSSFDRIALLTPAPRSRSTYVPVLTKGSHLGHTGQEINVPPSQRSGCLHSVYDVAEGMLLDWIVYAESLKIKELTGFAKTLRNHAYGILAYHECEITTGPLEGVNNKIKTMKRQSYGFRDLEYFKLKILALHRSRYALVG